jgi:branched-chain amino acid transport system ATP-binding protein
MADPAATSRPGLDPGPPPGGGAEAPGQARGRVAPAAGALLETRGLVARYGQFQALFGIDLAVAPGECLAIIGANGAGKTTLMRAITGVLRAEPGMVLHRGEAIGALPADRILRRGIAMVPEGRKLFPSLSVEENLLIGGQVRRGSGRWSLDGIYALFPALRDRRHAPGTALSGGQQQMVAIGRALMSNPELLLCDEISLGLAPLVIRDIYAALPAIRTAGTSVMLVEQDISRALAVADRVCCLMEGRVTLAAPAREVTRAAIHAAYFGAPA